MNTSKPLKIRDHFRFAATIAAATIGGSAFNLVADDTASSAPVGTNTVAVTASAPVKQHLTGAELYSIHCNRCHLERYPTERTAAQWKTIMLHMQVRANLPVSQAKLILQYLQENSGR
jgi:hypothetical protein